MPSKRRRSLSRSPLERIKMWDAKVKGDIYAEQLNRVKPLALDRISSYMVTHEYLISIVKDVIGKLGIDPALVHEYMWFAEKIEKMSRTYKDKALQVQADALYLWYVARGLNDVALRTIAQALGIKISAIESIIDRMLIPVMLKIISENSIVLDGSEQTILEYHGIATISGYVDLSSMEDGDTILIRAYVKVERDGDFKLYKCEEYKGRQYEPAVYIMPRLSGHAFKVTVQQTTGTYKSIKYLFIKG